MKAIRTSPFLGQGPDFNRAEADVVYGQLMKMDAGSAEVYGRMIVGAALQNDLFVHAEEIGTEIAKALTARTEAIRKQLISTSISKARAGQDNTEELSALVELSKAGFLGPLFSHFARSQRVRDQEREPSGRFEVMHEKVDIPDGVEPIEEPYANKLGIPWTAHKLPDPQRANFQHGYLQVERMLRPWTELGKDTGIVTYHYADGTTSWGYVPKGTTTLPLLGADRPLSTSEIEAAKLKNPAIEPPKTTKTTQGLDPMRKLTAVTVEHVPKNDAAGGLFSAFNALGLPGFGAGAARATESGVLNPDSLTSFDNEWNQKNTNDQFMPSSRVFRRLGAGSQLIDQTLGSTSPPQVKMALAVAQHVGTLGPKAHKIVAPTLDRAAYRYRGTERNPDKALLAQVDKTKDIVASNAGVEGRVRDIVREQRQEAKGHLDRAQRIHDRTVANLRASWDEAASDLDAGRISDKAYKKRASQARDGLDDATKQLADARNRFAGHISETHVREQKGQEIEQETTVQAMRRGMTTRDGRWTPGPVLEYMFDHVPSPELADLQLKSGVVPPSEGIILSGDGRVKAQTIGYGDDHYLPFTLRNLAGLKGGYYIRTRTFGGPTSEDIYTALMSGAKGLTVVSNNGVFTLDFEHDLKGGRRFNDKAARMVSRYGSLLDAVQSGHVPGDDIEPSRMRELQQKANGAVTGDPVARSRYLNGLIDNEKADPQLSGRQREQVAGEFLNGEFERLGLGDGKALSLDDMARYVAGRKATTFRREHLDSTQAELNSYINQQVTDITSDPSKLAERIADELQVRTGLHEAMERATTDNRNRVQPLRLDGRGYDVALKALRQQFPYYIADTKYEAFRNGTDKKDSGYVKPKFNRPGEALAGYFDHSIGGGGKVTADTIRNQNAPMHITPKAPENLARAERVDQAPPASGATESATAPEQRAAAGAAGALGGASPAELRNKADRVMLDHLLSKAETPLSDEFTGGDGARGKPITTPGVINSANLPAGVKAIFGVSPDTVRGDQLRNPEAFHSHIVQAVKWAQDFRAWSLDRASVDSFLNEGKPSPVQKVTDANWHEAMANPTREFDFAAISPVFMKESRPTKDAVVSTYEDSHLTVPVRAELPPVTADEFDDAIAALFPQIESEDTAYKRWVADDRPFPAPARDQLAIRLRGQSALAAAQLRRRFKEAVGRETEVAPPAPAAPVTEERTIVMTVDQQGNQLAIENAQLDPEFINNLGTTLGAHMKPPGS